MRDKKTLYIRRETSRDVDNSVNSFGKAERMDVVAYEDKALTKVRMKYLWNDPEKPSRTAHHLLIGGNLYSLVWHPDLRKADIAIPFPFKPEMAAA